MRERPQISPPGSREPVKRRTDLLPESHSVPGAGPRAAPGAQGAPSQEDAFHPHRLVPLPPERQSLCPRTKGSDVGDGQTAHQMSEAEESFPTPSGENRAPGGRVVLGLLKQQVTPGAVAKATVFLYGLEVRSPSCHRADIEVPSALAPQRLCEGSILCSSSF